jgi:hypothetical protein
MRMVVVLPAPFGPKSPTISPVEIEKLTSSTALNVPNDFDTPQTSIIFCSDFFKPRPKNFDYDNETKNAPQGFVVIIKVTINADFSTLFFHAEIRSQNFRVFFSR